MGGQGVSGICPPLLRRTNLIFQLFLEIVYSSDFFTLCVGPTVIWLASAEVVAQIGLDLWWFRVVDSIFFGLEPYHVVFFSFWLLVALEVL